VEQYRQNAERHAEQQMRLRAYEQALPTPVNEQSRGLAPTSPATGFSY
jgi:hypothetical protein